MSVYTFPSGPFATNAYVFIGKDQAAVVVDPAPESFESIKNFIDTKQCTPKCILLTHSHWDHIADVALFKEQYDMPLFIHEDDAPNLENPGSDLLPCWIDIVPMKADFFVKDGEEIEVGKTAFKVMHTPGHSPGSVCYYCKEHDFLFSGDTLFRGTIGNLSFPTSRKDLMWDSLKKLSLLPSSTIVYPGHGEPTTIGEESWLKDAQKIFS